MDQAANVKQDGLFAYSEIWSKASQLDPRPAN